MTRPDAATRTLAPAMDPGELVVLRNTKWDGSAHWVVPGWYLGEDNHGHWVYQPAGSFCSRPGVAFFAASNAILLVPHQGHNVATFYDQQHPDGVQVYVDIATNITWQRIGEHAVECQLIDMDLDVLRVSEGTPPTERVFVDDEDEFAQRQVSMHYPLQAVVAMQQECDDIYAAVASSCAPFDGLSGPQRPQGTVGAWFAAARNLPPVQAEGRMVHRRVAQGSDA